MKSEVGSSRQVSGGRDRGGGPAGGMFRGLSSWLGLQQPVVDGRPVEGDGQPEGEAPPEPPSEAVAESAESELLHQAKDLGGESPASGVREEGVSVGRSSRAGRAR